MRYRADALEEELLEFGATLAPEHRAAVSELNDVLSDARRHRGYHLAQGDVIVFDNWKTLHGRSALMHGSQRHLRRVKTFESLDD